jgi:hypothetical protein
MPDGRVLNAGSHSQADFFCRRSMKSARARAPVVAAPASTELTAARLHPPVDHKKGPHSQTPHGKLNPIESCLPHSPRAEGMPTTRTAAPTVTSGCFFLKSLIEPRSGEVPLVKPSPISAAGVDGTHSP